VDPRSPNVARTPLLAMALGNVQVSLVIRVLQCVCNASLCVCVCVYVCACARTCARACLRVVHMCVSCGCRGAGRRRLFIPFPLSCGKISHVPRLISPPPFFGARVNTLVSPPGAEGWLVAPRHIVITTISNLEIEPAKHRRRRPWPW
jgi:hypothetical protein